MTGKNKKSLRDVFNIQICHDMGADMGVALGRAANLEKEIAGLAKKEGVSVVFHEYEELVCGAPEVLAEMPRDFAEKLRALDHVQDVCAPFYKTKPRAAQPT